MQAAVVHHQLIVDVEAGPIIAAKGECNRLIADHFDLAGPTRRERIDRERGVEGTGPIGLGDVRHRRRRDRGQAIEVREVCEAAKAVVVLRGQSATGDSNERVAGDRTVSA